MHAIETDLAESVQKTKQQTSGSISNQSYYNIFSEVFGFQQITMSHIRKLESVTHTQEESSKQYRLLLKGPTY